MSGRESWSHEWIPPPARGLVLEMVNICRSKILNNFHQQPIRVPPLCSFAAREPLYHAAHPLTFLYFAKLLSLSGLRGSDNSRAIIFLIILFPAQSSAEPGDCREGPRGGDDKVLENYAAKYRTQSLSFTMCSIPRGCSHR